MKRKSKFDKCVESVRKRGSAADPRAVCAVAGRKKYGQREMTRRSVTGRKRKNAGELGAIGSAVGGVTGFTPALGLAQRIAAGGKKRKNPAEAAIQGYEEFHGKPVDEFVEVRRKVHFHKHLSGAGELKKLVVIAIDGKSLVTLSRFGGTILAFNERKNQLFVEGGNQQVDLRDYGIDPRKAHELETLGRVKSIDYFTDKRHLGDEGGKALYRHKFRTTNEDGRHVTVRIARYPDLIYRVRDKQLEFSGGSYEIIAEGVDR